MLSLTPLNMFTMSGRHSQLERAFERALSRKAHEHRQQVLRRFLQ